MYPNHWRSGATQRSVALIGAGALVAGTIGLVVAPALAAPVRSDLSATCEGLADSPFMDVDGLSQADQDTIGCLYNYDIAEGRTQDSYAPAGNVTRQEMAIFIFRAFDYIENSSAVDRPAVIPPSVYTDSAELTVEGREAVDLLTELGVVTGRTDGSYDPQASISRAEMAVFINRLQGEIADQTTEAARYDAADAEFADVPDDAFYADAVYAIQSVGIVQGTGASQYSPLAPVNRNDMSKFILRHLDENVVAERVTSLVG